MPPNEHADRVAPVSAQGLAAYAEAGRFDDAVATAPKAIDLAKAAGQTDLATRNAELLELYRARKPYHEPAR